MKVLVISHMYPSSFNQVAGVFIHQQAKALVKLGHQLLVISPVPWAPFPLNKINGKWRKYYEVPECSCLEGITGYYPRYLNIPRGYFFEYSGELFFKGLKDQVEKIYEDFDFDIIHAHVALPDGYAGFKLKELYGKPLVVTIHGQDLQQTIYQNKNCRKAVYRVFEKADKIITVSDKLRKIARRELGFNQKVVTIHNGFNLGETSIDELRQSEDIKQTEVKKLLSVSNLKPTKGIDLNLKAISTLVHKYPNIEYTIVGDGPEADNLRKLSNELGIKQFVNFVGKVPHNEVINFMKQTDIYTMPSWNEGFGVVYLEAMACGKPVIGCIGEGIHDVIEHGKNGFLVEPKNVKNLIEVLDRLLGSAEEVFEIGKKARETVVNSFTWAANARQTDLIYREVLRDYE